MASSQISGLLVLLISGISTAHVMDKITISYKPYHEVWQAFKTKFERSYSEDEEVLRFNVFVERVKEIEAHNQRYKEGWEMYTMGITQFTDHLNSDGGSCHVEDVDDEDEGETGRHKRQTGFCTKFSRPLNYSLPVSVDWRQQGAVTPVGDQGRCGSCYSFGVTTTVSAQLKQKTETLTAVSEQQLVDCSKPDGTGCKGSNAERSFKYIRDVGGIVPSNIYPYRQQTFKNATPGSCDLKKYRRHIAANVTGCQYSKNEEDLKYMVAYVGPVYVSVVTTPGFKQYKVNASGGINIFASPDCEGRPQSHCLTVVGYGSFKGTDYWIIKNSWGTTWGDKGYGYIQRGNNMCKIGDRVTVPVVQAVSSFDGSSSDSNSYCGSTVWLPSFLAFLVSSLVIL